MTEVPGSQQRVMCFRVCDRRFPFLWWSADQAAGRWHAAGEGPCHYLATTPKGAWAEVVRHEGINGAHDLADLYLDLWMVCVPRPVAVPALDPVVLRGDMTSYSACQDEARRLRRVGEHGLVAPSAAVLSETAELFGVDEAGQHVVAHVPTETVVLFGPPHDVIGMLAAEGHPEVAILADVRSI